MNKPHLINLAQQVAQYVSCPQILKEHTIQLHYTKTFRR
jgi:hypothetical protein